MKLKNIIGLFFTLTLLVTLTACSLDVSVKTSTTTVPSTSVPSTSIPTTIPSTSVPSTSVPTTIPSTSVPSTSVPTTMPSTSVPSTSVPTTIPSTSVPSTSVPTTMPSTSVPTVEPVVEYTVTFVDTNIPNQTIKEGLLVTKPENPTKENYEFVGWFTDNTYSTEFDFNTPINKDTKIYAKFEEVLKYTVTFIVENEEYKSTTVNADTTVDKPTNPVLSGHSFMGWYLDTNFEEEFSFSSKITTDTILYAKFEEINYDDLDIKIVNLSGYMEGLFIEFNILGDLKSNEDYIISYKKSTDNSYTVIDSNLIRIEESIVRADILGLTTGTYKVKIEAEAENHNYLVETEDLQVSLYDRSGYAHFNSNTGVGAYNNDGSLKDNTVVVYVTDTNKNTVQATINGETYNGLANILAAQKNSNYPLVIRIIGRVGAATWNPIDYSGTSLNASSIIGANGQALKKANMSEDDIINNGYNSLNTTATTKLNGLTNKIKYSSSNDEFDSYFNMMDIKEAKNVTIEGVGSNAELFQWGFTWKSCSSIEIRNLTFTDYTEDACSFEGSSSNVTLYGNYWVHNNTFNKGNNYWDVTYEQDKPAGDGATDFKYCQRITSSYNIFYKCKKTGLIGGGDSNLTKDVTFHHNYYNEVGSRLPLGRQANMHIYNNYYYKCGTAQDIRANAFVFSEANYFDSVTNPQKVTTNDTYKYTIIKSYNDYLTGCGSSSATVVTSRTTSLTGLCKPDGSTNYTNFDTNSSLFYYDSNNKKSNVSILLSAEQIPNFIKGAAGAMTLSFVPSYGDYIITDNNNSNDDNNTGDTPIEDDNTTVVNSSLINFNNISTGSYTSNITNNDFTICATSAKAIDIASANNALNINNTTINTYLNLKGGGASDYRNITFTITKKAKITVYFAGGASRTLGLYNSNSEQLGLSDATIDVSTIINSTFSTVDAGTYYICSTGSGINLYCILIEYVE